MKAPGPGPCKNTGSLPGPGDPVDLYWTPLKCIFRWYIILDGYHIGKSSAPQARKFLAFFFEKWPLDPLKIDFPLVQNFRRLLN